MNPEEEALSRVVRLLEDSSIPYMVTGSMASSHHGRPRTTHDIDLVIDPEVCGESLDRGYIERWAKELGVLALWRSVAGPPAPSVG